MASYRPPIQTAILQDIPALPLVLPWACLCTENKRYMVVYGEMRLSNEYRRAQKQIAERGKLWWRGRPALACDVVVAWSFYFPDLRKRDPANYLKVLHDALTGIVYDDDQRISEGTFTRALDRTNPRVELVLQIADVCATLAQSP